MTRRARTGPQGRNNGDPKSQDADYMGKDLQAMAFASNYHKWIIDEFSHCITGTVAEVGAGSGNLTALIPRGSFDRLFALEPAPTMYKRLEQRYAEDPKVQTFNAYLSEKHEAFGGSLDTLIYNNVMEHIEDDEAELRYCLHALKPGGRLLMFVPALNWLYSEFDRGLGHFRRYHRKPAKKLFIDAGFEIEYDKYVDLPGIIPWLIAFRWFKRELSPGKVSLYDRFAIPIIRALESKFPPPIGKNLLIIGRKPF